MPQIQHYLPEIMRLIRFGIVGVGATLVHIGVALLSLNYIINSPQISNAIGFLVAFIVSFTGQYFWTFKSTKHPLTAVIKFFCVALTGFLGSAALLGYLSAHTEFAQEIKLILSICIIPFITYITGKYFIF